MKLEEAIRWCAVLCLLSSSVLLAQTPSHSVKDNGAIGDGRADDTAPLQSALNLGGTIYLPPGTYLISKNLTIGSHTTLQGPGTIEAIRPGIASISIEGHAENPTNVSHAIASSTSTIPTANSLKKGDVIEISSFPSDQSDSYTVPNGCTLNCPRYYAANTARSQRSFRRKEINEVASATPQSITLVHATLSAYPATVIKKITAASSISLRDLTLHNVNVQSAYAADLVIDNVTAVVSSFVAATCYRCHINYANFDAQGTESRVDIYESSRFLDVSGTYKNFNADADNGIVKINQASDVTLNVSIGDTKVSGSGNPTLTHGVMIDTNYAENPTGFADVPSQNLSGTVTSVGTTPSDLFITANPFFAPVRSVSITTKRGTRVYLKGVTDATINIEGLCSALRLEGSQSITINGGDIGYLFTQELTDLTAPQSAKKLESITFNNSTFTVTDQVPFFHSFEGLLLNDVTFDVSHQSPSANAHFIPIANLNDVSNLVLKHLKVVQRSDQKGTQLWASGPVSNVSATGQVPVPFSTNIPITYAPR
jgi:hypothetical protein